MTESTSWGNLYRKYCGESRVQDHDPEITFGNIFNTSLSYFNSPRWALGSDVDGFHKKIRFQTLRPYTTEEQIKYIQATVPFAQYAIRYKHLQHVKHSIAYAPLSFFQLMKLKWLHFALHSILHWYEQFPGVSILMAVLLYMENITELSQKGLPQRQTVNNIRSNGWNSVKSLINELLILVVGFRLCFCFDGKA